MTKMNFTSNQTAFEYALYMIATSYINKAVCTTPLQEKKLKVSYLEQKTDKQYQMEEVCIRFMDELMKKLPKDMSKQDMQVRLIGKKEGVLTELLFCNQKYILRLVANYKGKNTQITSDFWTREVKKDSRKKKQKKNTKENTLAA